MIAMTNQIIELNPFLRQLILMSCSCSHFLRRSNTRTSQGHCFSSTRMRAIHVTRFTDSGTLMFTAAAPEPELDPASADMLVQVLACALNPGDCRLMDGSVGLVMKSRAFPYTMGIDLCGVVLMVGAKCDGFHVGDRVVAAQDAFVHGNFADRAIVSSQRAALAPPERVCSNLEAAALPVAGATAMQAIKDAHIGPGSRVLILGGSGGVGTLVLQLAKLKGAVFVATTPTNAALAQSLGADVAIDYRTTNWWDVLHRTDERERLDAVIDCVSDAVSWRRYDDGALKRHARYVVVVDAPTRRCGPCRTWCAWSDRCSGGRSTRSHAATRSSRASRSAASSRRSGRSQVHQSPR